MNLQDLRDELTARATTTDDQHTDLLPGVRRKIRRTRQRRFATAGAALVAVALAAIVVPHALINAAPDPAEPPSFTQNGFTLPGDLEGDQLLKGFAAKPGERHAEFTWTPTSKHARFDGRCRKDGEATLWVRVNGFTVDSRPCMKDSGPMVATGISSNSALWTDAPVGKPAKVTLDLVPFEGATQQGDQQLAVGIYQDQANAGQDPEGPDLPGDYVRDGLRFRKQNGYQTRLAAVIGDRGVTEVKTSFVPTGRSVVVQTLGTPDDYALNGPEYRVQVRISDGTTVNGNTGYGDATQASTANQLQLMATPGKRLTVTARVIVSKGKAGPLSRARIGVGIYDPGEQIIEHGISFDRAKDYEGTKYRFVRSIVVPATQRKVQLTTPVGTPFLWVYGSVGLGDGVWTRWDSLTAHQDGPMSGGFRWNAEDLQTTPKTVDFYVNAGTPAPGGKLAIALYTPEG